MSDFNSTQIDPRERLVSVGNELLDVIYSMDATEAVTRRMLAAKGDDDALREMMKEPGAMDAIVSSITNGLKRDGLVREYVTLRQTIEALTVPRPTLDGDR